jgi:deoxyribonuclease-4
MVASVLVHARYLINPAGPDPDMWIRSLMALREEYERSRILGVDGLVIHPGSHRKTTDKDGVRRAAEMIDGLLDDQREGPPLLLENTAGSGSSLGADFSQLADIRDRVSSPHRVAYCLDTAHAFAAGYDLRGETAVQRSLKRIDDEAGLGDLIAVHLNDSAKELGSRVDRHARIGQGLIGLDGFRAILQREEFTNVPGILETEPNADREGRYRPQVELLLSLRKAA